MNSLSVQNLNGLGKWFDPAKETFTKDLMLTSEWELTPDIAPWWIEPPTSPGDVVKYRRNLEPGELYKASTGYRPSRPLTPSNDERNLPSSWTQQPLRQLPHQKFPGSYPHKRIPYEEVRRALSPESGPQLPGWMPPPRIDVEEERAVAAALPHPWSSPEEGVYDISGFSDFTELSCPDRGVGVYVPSSLSPTKEAVATEAVKKAVQEYAATPWYAQALDTAAGAAALYLQSRQLDIAKKEEERRRQALAAQAQTMLGARAASVVVPAEKPFPVTPLLIGLGVLAALGLGYAALRS